MSSRRLTVCGERARSHRADVRAGLKQIVFACLLFVGCQEESFTALGDSPPIDEPPIEEVDASWSIEFFLPTQEGEQNRDTIYIFPPNGFRAGECNYAQPTPTYNIAKITLDGNCYVFKWMTLVPEASQRTITVPDSTNSNVWKEFVRNPSHVWTVVYDDSVLCFSARLRFLTKHHAPRFFEWNNDPNYGGINLKCHRQLVAWRSR